MMSASVDPLALDLPADSTAPRLARSAVAELLGEHPRRDDLLLCVSEVVTNAVLHAHSASQLRVRTEGALLLVECADHDPTLPARRQHDLQAPTGRGLHLLDALTVAWGTSPGDGGKIVWFEFDLGEGRPVAEAGTDMTPVRLLALPLAVHRRASEHGEALRRELSLVHHASTPGGVPLRLHELGLELGARYGGLNNEPDELLARAVADPEATTVDLSFVLPAAAWTDIDRLAGLLDELDQYCADRDLLTLVTPPEALAYRRWWLTEVKEQLRDGRPPRPWTEPGVGAPPGAVPGRPADTSEADQITTVTVVGDLDLEQAPQLREELVGHVEAGARRILVDLADCRFLDSTGISLLVTTHLRLVADGGGLALANLTPQVAAVIELAGLEEMIR
jgi:anti-anti-sigma factor